MCDTPEHWFHEGLQFECLQCGRCCGGSPGSVRASDGEVAAMGAHLGISGAEFADRYLKAAPTGGNRLLEKANYDCIFYEPGQGCAVYPCRPRQCRTWPFWQIILRSPGAWAMEAGACPGMNHGRLYSEAEILAISRDDGTGRPV